MTTLLYGVLFVGATVAASVAGMLLVRRATRLPESWALAVVGLVLVGLTVLSGWLLLPPLVAQAGGFLARLPGLVTELEAALTENPFFRDALSGTPSLGSVADRAPDILARTFSTLSSTFGALANVLLVGVTGIFLAGAPVLVFLLSILVAFWNPSAALLSWLLVVPLGMLLHRLMPSVSV